MIVLAIAAAVAAVVFLLALALGLVRAAGHADELMQAIDDDEIGLLLYPNGNVRPLARPDLDPEERGG